MIRNEKNQEVDKILRLIHTSWQLHFKYESQNLSITNWKDASVSTCDEHKADYKKFISAIAKLRNVLMRPDVSPVFQFYTICALRVSNIWSSYILRHSSHDWGSILMNARSKYFNRFASDTYVFMYSNAVPEEFLKSTLEFMEITLLETFEERVESFIAFYLTHG